MRALAVLLLLVSAADAKKPKPPRAAVACAYGGQCTLRPQECCWSCTQSRLEDAMSYNADWVEAHGNPGCVSNGCPDCVERPPTTLVATCEKKTCAVKDLAAMPLTACKTDDECVPEVPFCCSCSWVGAVAVRKDAVEKLRALTCGAAVTCPACAREPEGPKAACREGRCVLVEPPRRGEDPNQRIR